MIKVYQIQLTDAEIDAINAGEESDKSKAYFGRWFDRTFKAENFKFYTHVANVETDDLDEAFEGMNLWYNNKVTKLTRSVSSMSVGDILEDADGKFYRCASFGFTALEI